MVEAIVAFFSHPLVWLAILGGIGGLIYWKGQVDSDRKSFKEFMQEVRGDIKTILERLPPKTVIPGSPLRLTSFGKKIAEEFGAQEWVDEIVVPIATSLAGKEPFQIDDYCQKNIESHLDPDDVNHLGQCAYEHGIEPKNVADVLRVVLREEILKRLKTQYRCLKDDPDKLWHNTEDCISWPTKDFEVSLTKPTVGVHCKECEMLKDYQVNFPPKK